MGLTPAANEEARAGLFRYAMGLLHGWSGVRKYLEWSRENLAVGVRAYLDHPGTRQLWSNLQAFSDPAVRDFINGVLGAAPAPAREPVESA